MAHLSAELNPVLAVSGTMLLVFGLFSAWMRRSWISGPAVAIAVGFLLGPAGFGLVASPLFSAHEATLLLTAETTLALGVMAAAWRIPPGFLGRQAGSIGLLLLVAMTGMWLISSGLVWLSSSCRGRPRCWSAQCWRRPIRCRRSESASVVARSVVVVRHNVAAALLSFTAFVCHRADRQFMWEKK